MKIKKMILKNFRCYEKFAIDFQDDINVIIGKNDIGKSTLLEALEIFFNNDTVKIDISDLNVKARENKISIGIVFEIDKNKEYLIDSDVKTRLDEEYLLNEDGLLEIYKVWDCSKDKLTATSLSTVLVANYLKTLKDKPLIALKIGDLKKELENYENSIQDYESVKKNTSSIIRKAIYDSISDKSLIKIDIPLDKDDGKKFFENISKEEFPLFFLFQTDRANKDTDREVQEPLKAITKQAISEVEADLENVKKQIEKKALQIGKETLAKLKEMSPEIANILKPNISNKAWDSLFSFSFESDDEIPINKRGSGVRRLILLNYFRAEAERKNKTGKNVIYAIEEPETSQHPEHQIMLINALIELSEKENHQVILTTHTPEIAKMVKKRNLFLVNKENSANVLIDGEQKLIKIAETLGLLPYYSKVVICVEGENDINFLLNINNAIDDFRNIIDLKKEKISIIPMTGSNLKNWVNRHYLENVNVKEFHLYDRDTDEKNKKVIDIVNNRKNGSKGILTKKREMENYIHPSLIEAEFDISCSQITANWDNEDIPKFIENNQGLKEKSIKRKINRDLSKMVTKEKLKEIQAYEEIKGWFEKIKEMFQNC